MLSRRTTAVRPPQIAAVLAKPLPTHWRAAIVASTGEGRVVYTNRSAQRLYGFVAKEAVGRDVVDLLPRAESRELSAEIMAFVQAGHRWEGEILLRRRSGLPWLAFALTIPLGDIAHGGGMMVGVAVPANQRSLISRDAARLEAELRRRLDRFVRRKPKRRPSAFKGQRPARLPAARGAQPVARSPFSMRLTAMHWRAAGDEVGWSRMQRVETYRLRAERIESRDRAFGIAPTYLASMWLRLADYWARRP